MKYLLFLFCHFCLSMSPEVFFDWSRPGLYLGARRPQTSHRVSSAQILTQFKLDWGEYTTEVKEVVKGVQWSKWNLNFLSVFKGTPFYSVLFCLCWVLISESCVRSGRGNPWEAHLIPFLILRIGGLSVDTHAGLSLCSSKDSHLSSSPSSPAHHGAAQPLWEWPHPEWPWQGQSHRCQSAA